MAARYDAFISYSHSLDGKLAPAVQAGLHRFAKPWYRFRAMRVFRDDASLSANAALWPSLDAALQASRWFLLLASPLAAGSTWVAKEIERWREVGAPERLLLVITDGEVAWDAAAGDFDWERSTAVPKGLRGMFPQEPRFVDVRWARTDIDLSLANPRFAEAIADLAAAVRGQPKDELLGEDVRQHHRTRRVVRATVLTLASLLAAAVLASVVAVRQRDRAESQARIATSRLLASAAASTSDTELELAFRLAAQGWALQDDLQTRGALLNTLLRSPQLVGYLPGTAHASALAYAATPDTFAVGTDSGVLTLWKGRTRERLRTMDPVQPARVASLAFDAPGERLLAGHADGSVQLWATSGKRLREWRAGEAVTEVAFSRDGELVLAATETGEVDIRRAADGQLVRRIVGLITAAPRLRLDPNGVLTIADGQGEVSRWGPDDADAPIDTRRIGAGMPLIAAYTPDLTRYAGQTAGNTPYVVDVASGEWLHPRNMAGPEAIADAMAFTDDGTRLATVAEGRLQLWDVPRNAGLRVRMPGVPGAATAVAFGPANQVVAVAAAGGVALWDEQSHAVVRTWRPQGAVPWHEVPRVVWGAASLAFSPDAALAAWPINTGPESWVTIWDVANQAELRRVEGDWVIGFSADGRELTVASDAGDSTTIIDVASGASRVTPQRPSPPPDAPDAQPWQATGRGGLGAAVEADGSVTLWDTASRQPFARIPLADTFDRARLMFDPEGKRLAVASPGGVTSLIDVDVAVWRMRVCSRAAGPLSDEEWTQIAGARIARAPQGCAAARREP